MTAYERGDIVLVPFPFTDQTTTKKRPAVVISSNNYNNASLDIVIMAVTSRTEKTYGIGECLIKNWKEASLLKPSSIIGIIGSATGFGRIKNDEQKMGQAHYPSAGGGLPMVRLRLIEWRDFYDLSTIHREE